MGMCQVMTNLYQPTNLYRYVIVIGRAEGHQSAPPSSLPLPNCLAADSIHFVPRASYCSYKLWPLELYLVRACWYNNNLHAYLPPPPSTPTPWAMHAYEMIWDGNGMHYRFLHSLHRSCLATPLPGTMNDIPIYIIVLYSRGLAVGSCYSTAF